LQVHDVISSPALASEDLDDEWEAGRGSGVGNLEHHSKHRRDKDHEQQQQQQQDPATLPSYTEFERFYLRQALRAPNYR
jgi:hypothetical protein